ncbi:MAG: tetratricopeptide repeat protein [Pseudomonadales bacterium]|nr:tetratricopeptide repeat protein [Pseudomonadales bacterium]
MVTDLQGNRLHGANSAAARFFDQAIDAFSVYRGDPVALLDQALLEAPEFALAGVAKGWLLALATEPAATAAARQLVAALPHDGLDGRTRSLLAALETLLASGWTDAALRLDHHNAEYPCDLFALQAGHLVDFFRAGSRSLRDRIARALPRWSADQPGYAVLLGMYAFGLEETGAYAAAEDAGRHALDRDPRDCWAHHAVAHVMEMQGRPQDGIGWMIAREPHWAGADNVFKVHNWWHRALWHLELGQVDEVFALYDGPIREQRSSVALDLVDASALLWRIELCGHDVGDRWQELAEAWRSQVDGHYPFNDWHAAMSAIGAGRGDLVLEIRHGLRAARGARESEFTRWARELGLPLVEGFRAFRAGDHARAVESLLGVRCVVNQLGGSHAQRDIIDWTTAEAATRGGMSELAQALAHERLARKPYSPVNQAILRRATAAAAVPRRVPG